MPAWVQLTTFGLVQLFMLVGLFGLLVPLFPGLVVMWLAALGYGIAAQSFSTVGIIMFVLITILMIIGSFADNVLMGLGAHKGGAPWVTVLVALIAGVAGTILFPPIGGIIAAPIALLLLEYFRAKDWKKAWKAFSGLTVGWGLSFVARFILGLIMIGLWWIWVWQG